MYLTEPRLVLGYAYDDVLATPQLKFTGDGGEEALFDGVQLTWRFMDDVVADLDEVAA